MASITKRFGGWQTRISYKKRNGKYTTFSKAGFKTKKAAQLYSNSIEDNIALGILPNDKKILTFLQNTSIVGLKTLKSKNI
ncbi:Arm DNA-binding domain-containing protein [Lactiplantibacillus plantarum]|nr:Arm DNA-binding domain-containing protein [Lactiplantibacillus plantarum]